MLRRLLSPIWACALFAGLHVFFGGGTSWAAEWAGREVERDGVRYVINPSAPLESPVTLATTEVWRVSSEKNDDVLFSMVNDVARDGEGNSYLLDSQLSQVHVISPDGRHLRSISREGEGPGESRAPDDVLLFSDGTVCVIQTMPGRVVLLTPDGGPAGDHPLPRGIDGAPLYVHEGAVVDDNLVLKISEFMQRETSIALKTSFVKIDANGNVVTTFWEQQREQDLAKITFDEKADAEWVWAAGIDGRFYINNEWDEYSIHVVDAHGTREHVIARDFEHRKRTARELESINGDKDAGRISPDTKVSETSRDVVDILPREDGTLWVLSSRGENDVPDGTIAAFDQFDASGRFTREVTLSGPYRHGKDVFQVVGDYVYVVTNTGEWAGETADDEEVEVICLFAGERGNNESRTLSREE